MTPEPIGVSHKPLPSEGELRARLGAPVDAPQVMIVAESTHWDPNWLLTSTEYFRLRVLRTIDRAIDALVAEPRRVFSLECLFFVDLYWKRRPERREVFSSLANEGRLRFTGSGVTTPDTLLPEDELLVRDLLIGQEWLRSREMTQEPRMLYLPDSFGHSPGTPSLLAAAGLSYSAICRIDGMRFPGADLESAKHFPRPGTSAEHLLSEGTADFVWRGPDGSEVLTHWMTYGYGHGDMIASGGLSRALGLPTSWPDRRDRHVTSRIENYISDLTLVARTPYLLLSIGFDFVHPVPHLIPLIDRWNGTHYERTGVWLANAGLDDYLDLVSHHQAALPTLSLDPNPYWMGFYASRPDIKEACRELGRRLIAVDNESARATLKSRATADTAQGSTNKSHSESWWRAVTSNHHDYVTGTAPDRVANGEQARWLRLALSDTSSARASDSAVRTSNDRPACNGVSDSLASWTRDGAVVTVTTPSITAVFDEQRGGALTSLKGSTGDEYLLSPSLELRSYAESGGLWRMGQEFNGGHWDLKDRSTNHPATVTVVPGDHGGARVEIHATLEDRPVHLTVDFEAHTEAFVVRSSTSAPHRRTVTLATHQRTPIAHLEMHQPGGVVVRELKRFYEPTYWPLHSFAAALPVGKPGEILRRHTVATASPTAVHVTADGTVETVVARTATKELAFRTIPVLAPAWGRKWGTQHATLAMAWTETNGSTDTTTVGRSLVDRVDRAAGRPSPEWLAHLDDPLVEVIAVKVAHRGAGLIVRLRSWAPAHETRSVQLTVAPRTEATITHAWRTDSLERDLRPLLVDAGSAQVDVDSYLTTIRLLSEVVDA